jgi:oxazoline/thiazoline synthase
MLNIPVIKAHFHVEVIPGEGVLLLSDEIAKTLHGGAYEKIVPLIDGIRSTDEIVDALMGEVDVARVYYVLNGMETKGLLAEATPDVPTAAAAFWHSAGVDPAAALAAMRTKSVAVQTIGEIEPSAMHSALAAMGIRIGTPETADLLLILTDDYLRADLAAINKSALQTNRPWLLVRVTGRELWIGPLFQPGDTGCWECLRHRLQRNRAVHRFVAETKSLATPPFTSLSALPATRAAACEMAAVAAAQFLAGAANGLEGKVRSLDWTTQASQSHTLVRRPNCPVCGKADTPATQPIELKSHKAAFVRDGGHRSVSPEKTLKKYQHLVSPITGVVRVLLPVREDEGIAHVYVAGHNDAMKMDRLEYLKLGLRNLSSGKGMTELQAKVSALCEAVERYSGELTGGEMRVTRAFKDWKTGEAYHPNDVMLYSTQQYIDRQNWNMKGSRFNNVPEPYDETMPIDWTPLWSLSENRHKYLPTQLVYYRALAKAGDDTRYAMGCSNGNAAGNTLEEAILQGFFELVERDAVAVWWYNRLKKPGVDVESFGEPYLMDLIAHYETLGRESWALDVTTDLGIPAFVAVSRSRNGQEERILFGLGCHLEARIALQRAFAEMNQMLGLAQGDSDGTLILDDEETLSWLKTATAANQPYMTPDATVPARQNADFPNRHSGDLLDDILLCRQIVEERGMEMLVLDQTRSDVNMPVVKVVVPGLRHFWARFAPGRLYDVPVRQGWLSRPLKEEELNPISMFF